VLCHSRQWCCELVMNLLEVWMCHRGPEHQITSSDPLTSPRRNTTYQYSATHVPFIREMTRHCRTACVPSHSITRRHRHHHHHHVLLYHMVKHRTTACATKSKKNVDSQMPITTQISLQMSTEFSTKIYEAE